MARQQRNTSFAQESTRPITQVALYARVSIPNNQDPELQLTEPREYAGRRGWQVVKEFTDQGVGFGLLFSSVDAFVEALKQTGNRYAEDFGYPKQGRHSDGSPSLNLLPVSCGKEDCHSSLGSSRSRPTALAGTCRTLIHELGVRTRQSLSLVLRLGGLGLGRGLSSVLPPLLWF